MGACNSKVATEKEKHETNPPQPTKQQVQTMNRPSSSVAVKQEKHQEEEINQKKHPQENEVATWSANGIKGTKTHGSARNKGDDPNEKQGEKHHHHRHHHHHHHHKLSSSNKKSKNRKAKHTSKSSSSAKKKTKKPENYTEQDPQFSGTEPPKKEAESQLSAATEEEVVEQPCLNDYWSLMRRLEWVQLKVNVAAHVANKGYGSRDQWDTSLFGHSAVGLEPALRSGAIALLDAEWLVDFSSTSDNGYSPVLSHRQNLPPEAFLTADQVIENSTPTGGPQIIMLSYMWLHPKHPDPKGTTLQLVSKWLQNQIKNSYDEAIKSVFPGNAYCPRWAVFWDYASLYQHPDPNKGVYRTPHEDELFRQGLQSLGEFFSHPATYCIKVTQFPPNYPAGYNLPPKANCAEYMDRGWPLVESSLAGLVCGPTHDICQEKESVGIEFLANGSTRPPPMTPERMAVVLEKVSFTNAKDDRPLVLRLYTNEFMRRLPDLSAVSFKGCDWSDEQVVMAAEVVESGYMDSAKGIDFGMNQVRDQGCSAIARALISPKGPKQIRMLQLPGCGIGDSGVQCLVKCFLPGVLPELFFLDISNNQIGDAGMQYFALSIKPQCLPSLRQIFLGENQFGVAGCQALTNALTAVGVRENLAADGLLAGTLNLDGNRHIGDDGIQVLAPLILRTKHVSLGNINLGIRGCEAIIKTAESLGWDFELTWLLVQENEAIGDDGAAVLSKMLLKLKQLGLDACNIGDPTCEALGKTAETLSSLCPLERLYLGRNPSITQAGSIYPLLRLVQSCRGIEVIQLDERIVNAQMQDFLKCAAYQSHSNGGFKVDVV